MTQTPSCPGHPARPAPAPPARTADRAALDEPAGLGLRRRRVAGRVGSSARAHLPARPGGRHGRLPRRQPGRRSSLRGGLAADLVLLHGLRLQRDGLSRWGVRVGGQRAGHRRVRAGRAAAQPDATGGGPARRTGCPGPTSCGSWHPRRWRRCGSWPAACGRGTSGSSPSPPARRGWLRPRRPTSRDNRRGRRSRDAPGTVARGIGAARAPLACIHGFFGRARRIRDCFGHGVIERLIDPAAHRGKRLVARNREQPGREPGAAFEARRLPPEVEENLAHDVFGGRAVAHQPEHEAVHPLLMAGEQQRDRSPIALGDPRHQGFVRRAFGRTSCTIQVALAALGMQSEQRHRSQSAPAENCRPR